jgi:hypothetical protein
MQEIGESAVPRFIVGFVQAMAHDSDNNPVGWSLGQQFVEVCHLR